MRRFTRLVPLPLALCLSLSFVASAHAEWLPQGAPVCTDPAFQFQPAIAPDGLGGAFIGWADSRGTSGSQLDVYLQRLTAAGDPSPGWPLNGTPICTAFGRQSEVELLADGFGGVILAWTDSRDETTATNVYAQRIDPTGAIAPGWPVDGVALTRAVGGQYGLHVASDGAGGAFVVWTDQRKGDYADHDLYAQHVTGAGAIAAGWPADGLGVAATAALEDDPAVLSDGAGGAFFAWDAEPDGAPLTRDVFAARIAGDGTLVAGWPASGLLVAGGPNRQMIPQLVPDGSGGVIVAWHDERTDPEGDVYATRISGAGVLDPAWPVNGLPLCLAPSSQNQPSVVSDDAGGAIVAWTDRRSGIDDDVYAQRVTGAGAIAAGWPSNGALVSDAPGFQDMGAAVPDGAHGIFIVFYESTSTAGGLVFQHLDGAGHPIPSWSTAGTFLRTTPPGSVGPMRMTATSTGNAIATWQDDRSTMIGGVPVLDIYASALVSDGPVPALASLVLAEFTEGKAVVVWQITGGVGLEASVERRRDEGDWAAIGSASADGTERLAYADETVEPGHDYGYRLIYRTEEGLRFSPEAVVHVPLPALAIGRITARGSSGLEVAFTLPRSAPASLDLIDVSGRRVATRAVGPLGPGSHAVTLEGGNLAPGIYFVRLAQGASRAIVRAAVTR